jgi:diacylglycerol kinase
MKKALSIKRLAKSFEYAFNGLKKAFVEEGNMKIHFLMSILVIICGIIFKVTKYEWIILLFAIGLVISAELHNTAIENLVDLVVKERNKTAGEIKDVSASFVLVLSIISAIVGLIIFIPKIFS